MKRNLIYFILIIGVSFNAIAKNIKNSIYTANAPAPIGTYSQGIKFENILYISGQIPVDPKTGDLVQGDFKDNLRQVFKNISEIAKSAGTDINHTIKLTIYVTDLNNFNDVNTIMNEYFDKPYPARAVIEIKALPKNASVEVEATVGLI